MNLFQKKAWRNLSKLGLAVLLASQFSFSTAADVVVTNGAPSVAVTDLATTAVQQSAPIVRINTGLLRGTIENGIESYKGIPYAEPPVGELRWRPPQPPKSWEGVYDATEYKSQFAQNSDLGVFATPVVAKMLYILMCLLTKRTALRQKPIMRNFRCLYGFTGAV